MQKAKEILRIKHEAGLSLREIAQACNCGKSTVSDVIAKAGKAALTCQLKFATNSWYRVEDLLNDCSNHICKKFLVALFVSHNSSFQGRQATIPTLSS